MGWKTSLILSEILAKNVWAEVRGAVLIRRKPCLSAHFRHVGPHDAAPVSVHEAKPLKTLLGQSLTSLLDAVMRVVQSTNERLPWLAINGLIEDLSIEPSTGFFSYSCTRSKTAQSTLPRTAITVYKRVSLGHEKTRWVS
jgi:hypothetical protein